MPEADNEHGSNSVKIVVLGDGNVGKTCLLFKFVEDKFEADYVPTIFDHKTTKMQVEHQVIDLNLWDTAGQEEFDRLRPLSYPDSDVFIICFSLDRLSSLQNVKIKWWPEVCHHKPKSPIVLVGTKLDLVSGDMKKKDYSTISKEAGNLATEIRAAGYIECSAKDGNNCIKPFETAVRAVLYPETLKSKKRKLCNIL